MQALWRFLTSRNTAIVLLIVVSVILLIGAALPNPALMSAKDVEEMRASAPFLLMIGENFNSMKIGRSSVFGMIGVLLIISTTFCSIDRVIKKLKARGVKSREPSFEGRSASSVFSAPLQEIELKIVSLLRERRWKADAYDSEDSRIISAQKGEIGFWGSIFFHAILISLIAGIAVYYFSAFYATIMITEGQVLKLEKETLSRIDRMPAFGIRMPELLFQFNKFSSEYYNDRSATDYTADFNITDLKTGKQWKQIFKINEPLNYYGIDFLMNMQGYSPNFVLYRDGVQVDDVIISLDFDQNFRDSFDMRKEGLRIVAQFFPDMARSDDGGVYTKTFRPKNPYFGLEIYQNGVRVFRGLVGKGQGVSFGEYTLVFQELRNWITLSLVRETGLGFFFVCSMIGLAGIFVRMIDPEKRIVAVMQDTCEEKVVTFYYSAKHFEGILREDVEEMIRSLDHMQR
ncbi:MAG: hypothetical protein C4538_04970 [Nitrospiraceae bacterium]|nr:MAG: hypothetical protein C4538_04970 [Nitrospiraceae bacterium]